MDPRERRIYAKHNDVRKSTNELDAPFISPKHYSDVPTSLTVNQPGDKYEKEADQMADYVTRKPSMISEPPMISQKNGGHYQVRRMCTSCQQEGQRPQHQDPHQVEQITTAGTPLPSEVIVQRKCDHEINKKWTGIGTDFVSTEIDRRLQNRIGYGNPVTGNLREKMEMAFSADFRKIRIHTDSEAAFLCQQLNAQAFTFGSDIFFDSGKFDPGSISGLNLIAHEFTHVCQNREFQLSKEFLSEGKGKRKLEKDKINSEGAASDIENPPVTTTQMAVDDVVSGPPVIEVPGNLLTSESSTQITGEKDDTMPGQKVTVVEPTSTEEDELYQKVINELGEKSKQQQEPHKQKGAKEKVMEIPPKAKIANEKSRKTKATAILDAANEEGDRTFTREGFVKLFGEKVDKVAKALPTNKEQNRRIDQGTLMGAAIDAASRVAKVELKKETAPLKLEENLSREEYLRQEQARGEKIVPGPTSPYPAGPRPVISNPADANPKPKSDEEIALEKESQELDDYFAKQEYEVKEENLFLDISREKDFDDAVKTKRQAQEETRKVPEQYRSIEAPALIESQVKIDESLNSSLGKMHSARKGRFKDIQDSQQLAEINSETRKERIFREFQEIYDGTKADVDRALCPLNSIDERFADFVKAEEAEFSRSVKVDLQYICPCCDDIAICDTSDWREITAANDIIREMRSLMNQDGIDDSTQKEINGIIRERGLSNNVPRFGGVYQVYWKYRSKAYDTVQECHFEIMFHNKKESFIERVKAGVNVFAFEVVNALNEAKACIKAGEEKARKKYECLSDVDKVDKEEGHIAFESIKGQFENLKDLVNDQHDEVINSMARIYTTSVNKLRDEYERLKKENETTWLEAAWNKVKAVVKAIINFARRIVKLLGRLVYLVGDIIASPGSFFDNLIEGVTQGFSTFIKDLDTFLSKAFFTWIRGSSGIAIDIPKTWNPKGIFKLFTQLLNLDTETIWLRVSEKFGNTVADAFRKGEKITQKGLEVFGIVRRDGLAGIWEYVKDSIGNVLTETLEMIKETVLYAAIKKIITEIGKLLIPGGGFLAIAEKIVRLLQFIFDARDKILDMIEAFLDSVEMAVKGNIPAIISRITDALTQFITLAIDFLVAFFGLRSLKEKVQRFIDRMKKPIIRGIDWLLDKLAPIIRKIFRLKEDGKSKEEESETEEEGRKIGDTEVGKKIHFRVDGERHQLWIDTTGPGVKIMLRSIPMTVEKKLDEWESRMGELDEERRKQAYGLIRQARNQYNETKRLGASAEKEMEDLNSKNSEQEFNEAKKADDRVEAKEEVLGTTLRQLFEVFGEEEINLLEMEVKKMKTEVEKIINGQEIVDSNNKPPLPLAYFYSPKAGIPTKIVRRRKWKKYMPALTIDKSSRRILYGFEGSQEDIENLPKTPEATYGPKTDKGFGTWMSICPLTANRHKGSDTSNAEKNETWDALKWRIDPAGGSRSFYVRGHLLSEKLSGPGIWINLTPITQIANSRHEILVESPIKNLLRRPDQRTGRYRAIEYEVKAIYNHPSNSSIKNEVIQDTEMDIEEKRRLIWILEAEDHIPSKLTFDVTVYEFDPDSGKYVNEYKLQTPSIENDRENINTYVVLGVGT